MKLEHIEQFTRGENPIKSLYIGKRAVIENWFKTWVPDTKYEIDDDLNIRVKKSLWLQETKVASLPDNLYIEEWLDLWGTNIVSLPDNLHIEGSLNLRETKIISLPDNLYVGGYLYISKTKITYLPDHLQIGRGVYKNFHEVY